jgi:hypothetical protein
MIAFLEAHSDAVIAFVSAALGAVLGFFGSLGLWWLDSRRQQQIVRMRVALNLRRWINEVLSQMYDVQNYDSSGGHAGTQHGTIPDFLFEESLEHVATVDYRTANKIFGLIHKKDDAKAEIKNEIEFGDDDDAFNMWRGRSALLWLDAVKIYDRISVKIGWSEQIVSEKNRAMMQGEIDDFQKRKQEQAKSQSDLWNEIDSST